MEPMTDHPVTDAGTVVSEPNGWTECCDGPATRVIDGQRFVLRYDCEGAYWDDELAPPSDVLGEPTNGVNDGE